MHRQTPSYLEPNSQSLHVPIEGVYRITEKTEKIESRVPIGRKTAQNHDENAARTYLEPNRNSMHKPIEGRSCPLPQQSRATNGSNVQPIYKGAKDKTEHNRTANSFSTQKHTQHPQKLVSIAPLNSRFRFSFHKLIISKID